jgi:hypothetical protein
LEAFRIFVAESDWSPSHPDGLGNHANFMTTMASACSSIAWYPWGAWEPFFCLLSSQDDDTRFFLYKEGWPHRPRVWTARKICFESCRNCRDSGYEPGGSHGHTCGFHAAAPDRAREQTFNLLLTTDLPGCYSESNPFSFVHVINFANACLAGPCAGPPWRLRFERVGTRRDFATVRRSKEVVGSQVVSSQLGGADE